MSEAFDPRRMLGLPAVYQALARMLGARDTRERFKRDYLKLRPGERILDIGCGPADILATLPPDVDYTGFDMEPRYIRAASQRYGDRGRFMVRAVSPDATDDLGTFDLVMAIGVLHHLTDAQADIIFASAARILKPGGRLITYDGAFVPGQSIMARVLLKMDRGRHVRPAPAYAALARRHFAQVEMHIVHDFLVLPYTLCILRVSEPLA